MNKYLVLYRADAAVGGPSVAEMFANTPPEQLEAGMKMWTAWMEKCGSSIVDAGAPLDKSTIVTSDGSTPTPSSNTGFTILQAGSMDEAVALMDGHPHFFMPGASVEILECVNIPGM
jgi:hypothetical protein